MEEKAISLSSPFSMSVMSHSPVSAQHLSLRSWMRGVNYGFPMGFYHEKERERRERERAIWDAGREGGRV